MKQIIIEALVPVVSAVLAIVVPAALGWFLTRFQMWTGMAIEAKHREALQSALANAGRLLATGATKAAAIDYVRQSVPDALKALKAHDRVEDLLAPHLPAAKET